MENNILDNQNIVKIDIEDEMKKSYLEYAMSVIVSRAIPDVRDGLKPVHRRILYAMKESGCDFNKPYKKSARIVGEVMGKYHPHGDAAIYDSLVRMAQDFSLRLPLIDGQGNFGSMDGDSPAAMRYTESRLAKISHKILADIESDTVDFQDNYDGSEREPVVLPARFPNLLVNGGGGIAVGMATNIPPHNLGEVIDACCLYIENHNITNEDLIDVIQGPDFPTGGIILGKVGIMSAIRTGRGSIIIRGKTNIEKVGNKEAIIVTEMPYMVNKAKMIEKIAELVRDKKIEGISDIRDESDKSGVRVVIEIKRDSYPDVVLNQLFKFTQLQTSFGVNLLALNEGKPEVMSFIDVIKSFVVFREDVVSRRTKFLLDKSRSKAHLLLGLYIAVANIDEVIRIIRQSKDPHIAKADLMAREWPAANVESLIKLVGDKKNTIIDSKCKFTEEQAKAILEMRLQRLTGMEQEKIASDLQALAVEIKAFIEILGSRVKLLEIVKEELLQIKEEFATPRKTLIDINEFEHDIEDLIQKEDMVVTVTHAGYIKRVPLSSYRAQRRGGKGRSGINMREEDFTSEMFIANTHMPVLFFSNLGQVYKLKVYKLPLGTAQSKGRALINIFPLRENEKITTVMPLPEEKDEQADLNIMFATAKGNIRRNSLEDFYNVQSNGKIAIRLDEDDKLVAVKLCTESDHILLAASQGKCIRFPVSAVRVFKSRTSDGVRGMKLNEADAVISMTVLSGGSYESEDKVKYLKIPLAERTMLKEETFEDSYDILAAIDVDLPKEKIIEMAKNEEFIMTITENGFGKRTSSYEYRITNRGGSGIINIITSERNGNVVASFPVLEQDQVMLITDKGTLIRTPVHDVRVAGRNTLGVTLFRTAKDEKIISAAQISDAKEEEEGDLEEENIE